MPGGVRNTALFPRKRFMNRTGVRVKRWRRGLRGVITSRWGLPDCGSVGLWECWTDPAGEEVFSYSMLTVNTSNNELMRNFHRPEDEKRMVVILPKGLYGDWLRASAAESMEFMRQYPAERLAAAAGD